MTIDRFGGLGKLVMDRGLSAVQVAGESDTTGVIN